MYSWKDALAHIPHSYDRLFPSRYVFDPEQFGPFKSAAFVRLGARGRPIGIAP